MDYFHNELSGILNVHLEVSLPGITIIQKPSTLNNASSVRCTIINSKHLHKAVYLACTSVLYTVCGRHAAYPSVHQNQQLIRWFLLFLILCERFTINFGANMILDTI
jgi:hypothetical protein